MKLIVSWPASSTSCNAALSICTYSKIGREKSWRKKTGSEKHVSGSLSIRTENKRISWDGNPDLSGRKCEQRNFSSKNNRISSIKSFLSTLFSSSVEFYKVDLWKRCRMPSSLQNKSSRAYQIWWWVLSLAAPKVLLQPRSQTKEMHLERSWKFGNVLCLLGNTIFCSIASPPGGFSDLFTVDSPCFKKYV